MSPNRLSPFLRNLLLVSIATSAGLQPATADVTMPLIFGDHMILQQESKLPVWGWADPGEDVTVSMGGKSAQAKAGPDGKWRVDLPAFPAGTAAMTLTVTGKNKLTFSDVLLGDVWIAAGQSNMEIPVGVCHNAAEVMAKADDPQLRFFNVLPITTLQPETGLRKPTGPHPDCQWLVCAPDTVAHCSGVSYFFARSLRQSLHRPIGMINSTFYSSAAEAWTPVDVLEKHVATDPMVQPWLDARQNEMKISPAQEEQYNKDLVAYPDKLKQWTDVDLPAFKAALKDWYPLADQAKAAGQPPPPQPPGGVKPQPPVWPGAGGIQIVGNLFNGMIAPIIPYAIKGVIWYQGEANAGRADQYQWLLPAMIDSWREKWGEGDFPFLLVQLASFGNVAETPRIPHDKWPFLREAQFQIAGRVKNSGIATALDLGAPNNIHPRDKMDVGERMALVARDKVYGEKVLSSGPTFSSMKIEDGKIRVTFSNVGSGLVIAAPPWIPPGYSPPPLDELHGFAIAGDDQQWVWAKATIEGNDVVVSSDQVPHPVAVCYGWNDSPLNINFYNKEGLPAFPFRTDNWPQ
jgi:sialate O-acetylesterase